MFIIHYLWKSSCASSLLGWILFCQRGNDNWNIRSCSHDGVSWCYLLCFLHWNGSLFENLHVCEGKLTQIHLIHPLQEQGRQEDSDHSDQETFFPRRRDSRTKKHKQRRSRSSSDSEDSDTEPKKIPLAPSIHQNRQSQRANHHPTMANGKTRSSSRSSGWVL